MTEPEWLTNQGCLPKEVDLTCRLVFTEDRPSLIISFDPFALTTAEISDLATVLEKTATKWVSCQKCAKEGCDKEVGDARRTESSRGFIPFQ